jgi:hypothetical protein
MKKVFALLFVAGVVAFASCKKAETTEATTETAVDTTAAMAADTTVADSSAAVADTTAKEAPAAH